MEKVEDGLWALRPEWRNVEYRLFFTCVKGAFIFVFVHAIKKKRRKLASDDLETARNRAKEAQERYASEDG